MQITSFTSKFFDAVIAMSYFKKSSMLKSLMQLSMFEVSTLDHAPPYTKDNVMLQT